MGFVGEHGGIVRGDFLYSTSQAYDSAIAKNARETKITGNIQLNDGGTSLALDLFNVMNAELSAQCVNGDTFETGAVYSSEFVIKISDWVLEVELLNGAVITPIFNIKTDTGTFESVPLGKFYTAEAVWTQKSVELTCYDSTMKLDKEFSVDDIDFGSNTSNVTTIYNVINAVCTKCDIDCGETPTSITGNIKVPSVISTCREMISYIAEYVGGFAYADRSGALRIKAFSSPSGTPETAIPRTDYFKLSFSDRKFKVQSVAVYDSENKVYQFIDNPNSETGEILSSRWGYIFFSSFVVLYANLLKNHLGKVNFTPSEVEWLGNPAIDLGDTIAIETGKGNTIRSLITHINWKYKGTQQLRSVGSTQNVGGTSDSEKQLINTISQTPTPSPSSPDGIISGYASGLPVSLASDFELNIPFKNTQATQNTYFFNGNMQISATSAGTVTVKYYLDGKEIQGNYSETVPKGYSFENLWTCLADVATGEHTFRIRISGTEATSLIALQFALNGQGINYEAGEEIRQMTGTGTEKDPFIVYTIEDFRWAINQNCSYVKLGVDLDCSELEYWTGVTVNAGTIDLDGHTVKNINITPISADGNYFITADKNVTIKNGTIQSVYGTNVRWLLKVYNSSYNSPRTLNLTDLKLSGIFTLFNASDENFIKANYTYCQRVSLNFKFQNVIGNPLFYSGTYVYHRNCNYNVDFSTSVYLSDGSSGIFNGHFYNSKLTGKIHMTSTSTSSDNSLFYELNSCVIACQISSAGTKIKLAYSGCNGATIVNKDLITATVVDTDSDIKLLTTAQMKDTDYLTNTAEFPVFEV